MMRTSFYALALLAIVSLATGCQKYLNPLTDKPTKDINTWLLGVWEYKNDAGKIYQVGVLPISGARYSIWCQQKDTSKSVEYEAWISRVGDSKFLTMKSVKGTKDTPEGTFSFLHYQVIDQVQVILRGLQLDSPDDASSKDLRKEVRTKLKARTLLPEVGTTWTRISDVYWPSQDDPAGPPLIPTRFPQGPPLDPLKVETEVE